MTVFSIRYLIWVTKSLNTNALYLSIPFLLVSAYLAILLTVTFVNNWSRKHVLHKKVDWTGEKKVWTIIPTYGETVEILEKTMHSWIEQDYPMMYRRLILSSQTPGTANVELVKKMNRLARKIQKTAIETRWNELRELRNELNEAVTILSEWYIDLSTYRPARDEEFFFETSESVEKRRDMAAQILEIEEYLAAKLGLNLEPIVDHDGNLLTGQGKRIREVGIAAKELCDRLDHEFKLHLSTIVDKNGKWLPVIHYSQPPTTTNSKALNLNSALRYMYSVDPEGVEYVETRDADDLAPREFLSVAIGTLGSNLQASFVQAKKVTMLSAAHPLEPDEPVFFDRIMPAKNHRKAVFPCGSGLVWRLSDLAEIGEFPNWNLVEDLYSGFLAWQKGKHGLYLEIIGAIGQVVPEDIPNIYKQRGTWALDTMRLFFWHSKRGLSFWQKLQFLEIGLFYLLSFPVLFLVLVPIMSLLVGIHPLITDHLQYALHFWPFAATVEIFLVVMADGIPYERIWKSRQTWFGLAPVYAKACVLALIYGPKRKPVYKVTRKYHQFSFYWKQTLVQWSMAFTTVFAIVFHLTGKKLIAEADLGSIFYAVFYLCVLSGILRTSRFGIRKQNDAQVNS